MRIQKFFQIYDRAVKIKSQEGDYEMGVRSWPSYFIIRDMPQIVKWMHELVKLRKENKELRQQLETMLWEECDCDNCGENIVGSPAYRIGQ